MGTKGYMESLGALGRKRRQGVFDSGPRGSLEQAPPPRRRDKLVPDWESTMQQHKAEHQLNEPNATPYKLRSFFCIKAHL
jgi:hypothetical protein